MLSLQRKYELILAAEEAFTRSISKAVFEKPAISLWMVLIPILLVHFIQSMQTYKNDRLTFQKEYMRSRRKALDLATEAVTHGSAPDIADWVRQATPSPDLAPSYRTWLQEMIAYYTALLRADGDDFQSLVHAAYADRDDFTAALEKLRAAENAFNDACKPQLAATPGAMEVIELIEERSRTLRRELASAVYDHPKKP
ncbi:MAG: NF038143 family protein [Pseudomonadota bacterium]